LAAGESLRTSIRKIVDRREPQRFIDRQRVRIVRRKERDVFAHGERSGDLGDLEHRADTHTRRGIPRIASEDAHHTGTRFREPEDQANRRRLPGTVGTEKRERLSRHDGKRDVSGGDDAARTDFALTREFDRNFVHSALPLPRSSHVRTVGRIRERQEPGMTIVTAESVVDANPSAGRCRSAGKSLRYRCFIRIESIAGAHMAKVVLP